GAVGGGGWGVAGGWWGRFGLPGAVGPGRSFGKSRLGPSPGGSLGGDAVPPLAAALAGRADALARPRAHESFLAAQALPALPLVDAIGFGLLMRFIRHDQVPSLAASATRASTTSRSGTAERAEFSGIPSECKNKTHMALMHAAIRPPSRAPH